MKYKDKWGNKILGIFKRTLNSLVSVECSEPGIDVLFKMLTLMNIVIKAVSFLIKKKYNLRSWAFKDCLVRVKFFDISYKFYCPRGFDFNIYLNPFLHENDITMFVYRNFQKGDTFIDVGAHGGLYTILASKLSGLEGEVLSIEPNSENLKYLKANVKLNVLRNVRVIPKALAEKKKSVSLSYDPGSTSLTSISETTKGNRKPHTVQTTTLDDVGKFLDSVKIIKIDTEGYDMNVLKGGKNVLKITKYIIVETNNKEIRDFLSDFSFTYQNLEPSGYLLAKNISI